ncbi:LOW QUALITY PROTEIN: S-type anion channel SLAH3-like [Curcuma longa]|uniref:LOW QUALITY PROTEIN: S-type anion channel SLAH3-like n=1 Tax=Curcuma longa TaxID=136217 RepID=UPI003D9EEC07
MLQEEVLVGRGDQAVLPLSVSISLPSSPFGPASPAAIELPEQESSKQGKSFRSQPVPARAADQCSHRDKRFDPFKTWSGRLERQLSNLRGKPQDPDHADCDGGGEDGEAVPAVDRYFDALEGPELETLRVSEVSILPEDEKWPFLLRFPISSFGICLGVGSQAILWKMLADSSSAGFLHVSPVVNLALWSASLAMTAIVSCIYLSKVVLYFEAVRREYHHPVRVNFFFAPWIAGLFLVLGAPDSLTAGRPPVAVWYVLMAPILCLELKLYGQWMSGGQRRLSKVANPSNHLTIVGNFVGALASASMGMEEPPVFFFAVGLAHYLVLFVTLYQRLPTNQTLPKELHPVFFLFVAPPSVVSVAWARINGEFDCASRIAYFMAMFPLRLAVRINFFRGFRFSLAWWAYTFPTTAFSIATIKYSMVVMNSFTRTLVVFFSGISAFTVCVLSISTIFHAFVLRDLFPNDVAIAIANKQRPKLSKFIAHLRSIGSDTKEMEQALEV